MGGCVTSTSYAYPHAQGICKYLIEIVGEEEAKRCGVVLGYDHRAQGSLSSKRFAELAAAACLHFGLKVFLYRGIVATPMVVRLRCGLRSFSTPSRH